jgi:hypothetical protein
LGVYGSWTQMEAWGRGAWDSQICYTGGWERDQVESEPAARRW